MFISLLKTATLWTILTGATFLGSAFIHQEQALAGGGGGAGKRYITSVHTNGINGQDYLYLLDEDHNQLRVYLCDVTSQTISFVAGRDIDTDAQVLTKTRVFPLIPKRALPDKGIPAMPPKSFISPTQMEEILKQEKD